MVASYGFKKWATYNRAWNRGLWLIPVNHNNIHWTLLVLLDRKIIIHIDSMHGDPDSRDIDEIANFIQSGNNKVLSWKEWILYIPKDNPSQILNSAISGNCGVHISIWATIIASGTFCSFSEIDMDVARRRMTNFLLNNQLDVDAENRAIKSRQK